jgi:MSHA biogenesis protein MshQ
MTVVLFALGLGHAPLLAQDTVRDDFNTESWGENSGTRPWTNAWTGDVDVETTRVVAAGELQIRRNNTTIQRSLDLSGYDVAQLNLSVRAVGSLSNGDRLAIDIFNGSSWRNLEVIVGSTLGSSFAPRTYTISQDLSATTAVRIRIDGGTGNPGRAFAFDFLEVRTLAPTCFTDTFNAAGLNPTDWATNSVSGSFGQPRVVNNRLRITDATGNVATAASLRRFFPGADNRVVVEFDYLAYGGSGADGVAVTLSDGNITPVAGGFGGSLGYAQRSGINGFAGGWMGVGIDEFGNFSNPTEARSGGPGPRRDAVALRGSGNGTSGYRYLAGTGTLTPGIDISGSTPGPNHRYRITVDNRAGVVSGARVSVERNTGSGFTTLVAPFDIYAVNPSQAAVPENFRLSLTGSTGGSTNIHELDNLQVCATRLEQLVEIDHFRFFHDGQGLTCEPESIVVQACLDTNCTQQVSGPLQVTLSPSGWVGGNTQTITSGQTLRLQRTTVGTAALTITASNPPRRPFTPDRCFVGGVQQANCNLPFVDAGFVHEVSNHVSDVVQNVTVRAVQVSDATRTCVPSFANVTRRVGFWSNYLNPTTGTQRVAVNGTAIGTAATGTGFDLAFNANGEANITVRYPDAGSVRLFSRYTGSAANGDAGLVMNGQDDFIAKPRDFLLAVTGSGPGGATTATGPVFARAGVPFSATVTARNNSGATTPNFGRETVPERVRLGSTLQAPVGGNNPDPVPSVATGFGTFSNGTATGDWRWDEVGIITLTPELADGDYLGYGTPAQPAPGNVPNVVGAALSNVGRFIPARLAVSANTPIFANACAAGSFGYAGQEFGFGTNPQLTVTGLNAIGGNTRNYDVDIGGASNPFWRFGGALANRTYANAAISTLATLSRTTNGGVGVVSDNGVTPFDGAGLVTVSGDRLTYAKPAAPEDPFNAEVSLALTAADLTDSDGVCFDTAALNGCDPLTIAGITGSEQRWGRISVTNAFGPEVIDLQVPMRAEFFNGTTFVANIADACSGVGVAPLVDANAGDSLLPSETCVQDSGSPGVSGQGCSVAGPVDRRYTATPGVGAGGTYTLWLRAPGAGNVGILDLTPIVPAWLQFDWRGTGLGAPTARVGFGVFQGDRRAIHEREVY